MSNESRYVRSFPVLWSDLDANGHMRGPRYLDYAGEMPFFYLLDRGFDLSSFVREQVGPVTVHQSVKHRKEARFGDVITIDHRLRRLSADGQWAFRHQITRADGELLATVESEGGFFSRATRKAASPPAGLIALMQLLPKEDDFVAD